MFYVLECSAPVAAESLADTHISEHLRMAHRCLCTAHRVTSPSGLRFVRNTTSHDKAPLAFLGRWQLSKSMGFNDRWGQWTRASNMNYLWMWQFFQALCFEAVRRFGDPPRLRDGIVPLMQAPCMIGLGHLVGEFPLVDCVRINQQQPYAAYRASYKGVPILPGLLGSPFEEVKGKVSKYIASDGESEFIYTNRRPPEWLVRRCEESYNHTQQGAA